MTEQTNAELIAKADKAARFVYLAADESVADDLSQIIRTLAERLEAADQRAAEAERQLRLSQQAWAETLSERNQYAAVVEKVRAADSASSSWDHFGHLVMDVLATAPADVLRELKADVWEEGFSRSLGDDEPINPYREEQS